jgi:hypothetical protein
VTNQRDQALTTAEQLLTRRFAVAGKALVPAPPATRLLQRAGMERAVERHFCNETLGLLLQQCEQEAPSVLVVDVSGTGQSAVSWLTSALPMFATDYPGAQLVMALSGTRWAGRGRLLARHLEIESEAQGIATKIICGPAWPQRSAPTAEEEETVRDAFDIIVVLALSGAAGLHACWPEHQGHRWLSLADGGVFSFIDPDSIVGDLPWLVHQTPAPLQLRVETLDEEESHLVGQVDASNVERAQHELPQLIEAARRQPWRLVAPAGCAPGGTALAMPSDTVARALVSPLEARRTLVAGRLRLVAGQRPGASVELPHTVH